MGSAGPSSLVRLFGCPCGCLPTRTHACSRVVRVLVVWVGCGPYSGRSRFLTVLTPGTPTHTKCVVLGVLLFVLAY